MERTLKAYEFLEKAGNEAAEAGSSHALMLQMIGPRKSVLEFGCANGYMSHMLVTAGCRVVGVEINPAIAAEARAFCEEVVVCNLDTAPLVDLLPDRTFDVIVFGDVLEHLQDPWRVLDESRRFLAPGGYAVLSIPNIAHGSVRLALLSGSFDYAEGGLLDDTHIRFFTHQSVLDLCTRAGYRIETIDRTKAGIFVSTPWQPRVAPEDYDPAIIEKLSQDPEAETFQFIVKATPLPEAQVRDTIYKQLVAARAELEEVRREARTTPTRRADELQHRLNIESGRTATQATQLAHLADELRDINRYIAELVSSFSGDAIVDESEELPRTLDRLSALLLFFRARLSESTEKIQSLEKSRTELALANANFSMDSTNRTLERDLALADRARAYELLEITSAELSTLQTKHAEREAAHARSLDEGVSEASRRDREIATLHAEATETVAQLHDVRAAFVAKEMEFAALGVLHRSLSDIDRDRIAAIEVKEHEIARIHSEIARLHSEAAKECERHDATRDIFSEFLAYEIASARRQTTAVDRMIVAYQSGGWSILKRFFGVKRRP